MPCCCTNVLDLCAVNPCVSGEISTGINAPSTGIYQLVLDYLGVEVKINADLEEGEPLNFPAENLNENYKYTGKIIGPDQQPVLIVVGETSFDCITFKTRLSYELNPTP